MADVILEDLYDELVRHVPDVLSTGTDSEVSAAASEATIVRTRSAKVDSSDLIHLLDIAKADTVLGTLQESDSPSVQAQYQRIIAVGQDFSDPMLRQLLPQVGKDWDPELLAEVLALNEIKTKAFPEGVSATDVGRARVWKANSVRLKNNHEAAVQLLDANASWEDIAAALTAE